MAAGSRLGTVGLAWLCGQLPSGGNEWLKVGLKVLGLDMREEASRELRRPAKARTWPGPGRPPKDPNSTPTNALRPAAVEVGPRAGALVVGGDLAPGRWEQGWWKKMRQGRTENLEVRLATD